MIVLKVKKKIEKLVGEVLVSEFVTDTLKVSVTPDSITMRQWTDFFLKKAKFPEWFKDVETNPDALQESNIGEYMSCIIELVSCFCDKPHLLRGLPIEGVDNSIVALYHKICLSIYSYTPQLRTSFEYKGFRFAFPKSVIDGFNRTWHGLELTTGEAIEALQASHILNAQNEHGEYVLNDRKYHTDIALLAALARKVDDAGQVEQIPIESTEMRVFFEERTVFFQDAPMSIALDMAFFLSSSKLRSVNTPTFQSLINLSQRHLMKGNEKKETSISGKLGAGR